MSEQRKIMRLRKPLYENENEPENEHGYGQQWNRAFINIEANEWI